MLKKFLIVGVFISLVLCIIQSCRHNLELEEGNYCKVLVDSLSGDRFILDTTQIIVTAINYKNDTLWSTDPWKDYKLPIYRVNRPKITYFILTKNEHTNNQEVIWIAYNNSQFGILNKKTGKFTWFGQD
jgi:hypothetical protein